MFYVFFTCCYDLNLTQNALFATFFEHILNLYFNFRTSSLCSHIFLVLRDHRLYVCLHLKMEFRSCARGRQWCGIFHYHWWTASIKPRLLFSHSGLDLISQCFTVYDTHFKQLAYRHCLFYMCICINIMLLSVNLLRIGASSGLTCLHCDSVEQPKYCARVELCQQGQVNMYLFLSICSNFLYACQRRVVL